MSLILEVWDHLDASGSELVGLVKLPLQAFSYALEQLAFVSGVYPI
jgi:hypothetical protein